MARIKGLRKRLGQKGASAVEFAVVLPLLLMILFSIIEYGWVMSAWIVLTNAASQGARAAILKQDVSAAVDSHVWSVMSNGNPWQPSDLTIETEELSKGDPEPGYSKRCRVTVSWKVKKLIGFLPSALMPETLTAESVMSYLE